MLGEVATGGGRAVRRPYRLRRARRLGRCRTRELDRDGRRGRGRARQARRRRGRRGRARCSRRLPEYFVAVHRRGTHSARSPPASTLGSSRVPERGRRAATSGDAEAGRSTTRAAVDDLARRRRRVRRALADDPDASGRASCSPRARPAHRRARCSPTASSSFITQIDTGGNWGGGRRDVRGDVVRAPRPDDEAARVADARRHDARAVRGGGVRRAAHDRRAPHDEHRRHPDAGRADVAGAGLRLVRPVVGAGDRARRRPGDAGARPRGARALRRRGRHPVLVHRGGHRHRHRVRRAARGRGGVGRPSARRRRPRAAATSSTTSARCACAPPP